MRSVTQTVDDLQAQLRTANDHIEYANRVRLEAEGGEKGYADALKQAKATVARQAATISGVLGLARSAVFKRNTIDGEGHQRSIPFEFRSLIDGLEEMLPKE